MQLFFCFIPPLLFAMARWRGVAHIPEATIQSYATPSQWAQICENLLRQPGAHSSCFLRLLLSLGAEYKASVDHSGCRDGMTGLEHHNPCVQFYSKYSYGTSLATFHLSYLQSTRIPSCYPNPIFLEYKNHPCVDYINPVAPALSLHPKTWLTFFFFFLILSNIQVYQYSTFPWVNLLYHGLKCSYRAPI